MQTLLEGFQVPGLAMASLRDCEPVAVSSHGMADLQQRQAVTDTTLFEAASLSKPVFAYLVLRLVDEGIIDLDRPLAEEFAYARILDQAAYARITPRMILAHSTGLPNWVGDAGDAARQDPIAFADEPGAAYSYSGEAFALLQAFVEHKTGRSLQQLFEAHLGELMPHSGFDLEVLGRAAGELELSRGYASTARPQNNRPLRSLQSGQAAGSLLTTARDYARFPRPGLPRSRCIWAALHTNAETADGAAGR